MTLDGEGTGERAGTDPVPGRDGTTPEPGTPEALADRLASAMAAAWGQGRRPVVEEYLAAHPGLNQHPGAAARLIYEEFCLREGTGEGDPAADLAGRFPRWEKELEFLLDCHEFVRSHKADLTFPEPGETLGDYHLLAELGQGLLGRVFLATQAALADRPVVLKVTRRTGDEHLALARLRHPHIVPIYAVHEFADTNLRGLCMPYLGGVTLAHVLDALGPVPPGERTGGQVLAFLDRERGAPADDDDDGGGGRGRRALARADFAEAVCGIGACLAEALQHSHDRGLLHLDLKPANVLLSDDARPMLLDFHIARPPVSPGGRLPERMGGTPGYMPPEQEAAVLAVSEGRAVEQGVDGRADVYALGVTLHQALGGAFPLAGVDPASDLPRVNPQVGPGLAGVVRKCLARDPVDRYADASSLARDLRRHAGDRLLAGADDARRPRGKGRAPSWATLLAFVLGALTAAAALIGGDRDAVVPGGPTAPTDGRRLPPTPGPPPEPLRDPTRGPGRGPDILPESDTPGRQGRTLEGRRGSSTERTFGPDRPPRDVP